MHDDTTSRITFTCTRGNDEILMTINSTDMTHIAITEVYVNFLKAIGYSIDDLVSYDINDLAY